MTFDIGGWIWVGAGIALIVSEVFVPGGVVAFVGAAAVLVGIGQWLGWLESWISAFTAWFVISLVLLLALRRVVSRLLPGDSQTGSTDEDGEAFGTIVDVLETVSPADPNGRIRYQGTGWPAICYEGTIARGEKAMIAARDNLVWIVERVDPAQLADRAKDEG